MRGNHKRMKVIPYSVSFLNQPARRRSAVASRKQARVNVIQRGAAIFWSDAATLQLRTLADRLRDLSRNPEASPREIADLIRTDPALHERLLRAANSAYFNFGERIETVECALLMLGTDHVERMLVARISAVHRARKLKD